VSRSFIDIHISSSHYQPLFYPKHIIMENLEFKIYKSSSAKWKTQMDQYKMIIETKIMENSVLSSNVPIYQKKQSVFLEFAWVQ
jgi:hypothetical protein